MLGNFFETITSSSKVTTQKLTWPVLMVYAINMPHINGVLSWPYMPLICPVLMAFVINIGHINCAVNGEFIVFNGAFVYFN